MVKWEGEGKEGQGQSLRCTSPDFGLQVIDKPGGRVSGVYGGTFPAIGTVV